MDQRIDLQKQLAKFINYNNHPHQSSYNVVDSIVTLFDIKTDMQKVTDLLKLDYFPVDYNKGSNLYEFFNNWALGLISGKITVVYFDEASIDPVFYDQIIHLRESNSFNLLNQAVVKYDWSEQPISPDSHLFFVFKQPKDIKIANLIYEVSDHILDIRPFEN